MYFSEIIENNILSNIPFALLRLPKKKQVFFITEDNKGTKKYSFISFDNSKKYSFLFSNFQEIPVSTLTDKIFPLKIKKDIKTISKENYIEILLKAIQYMQEGKAKKIVISRKKWIEKAEIHPIQSFLFLCEKYPDSFCHLSFWNKEEIWLGATPEILGLFENSTFSTVSLAGTLPDRDSIRWEEKEITEQKLVTDYIYKTLHKYSQAITTEGPQTLHLGHIKHLITYFNLKINTSSVPQLIDELHPTPAVCGIPLDASKNYILNQEGYNRDFYAGYIGLETEENQKYFVNLRSAKLYQNGALLFIGGGITAQSIPEKEWEETEWKSQFIAESL